MLGTNSAKGEGLFAEKSLLPTRKEIKGFAGSPEIERSIIDLLSKISIEEEDLFATLKRKGAGSGGTGKDLVVQLGTAHVLFCAPGNPGHGGTLFAAAGAS